MLVSSWDGMNREEKSPVSFVLFVQIMLIRLKATRNYSPAFIDGLVGSALKKDNVAKHRRLTCTARL